MNAHPQTPVLVIGAGISGLATAYFLHRKGVPVRVLEAAPGVGGCVSTLRQDGWLIERGPNSTLDNTPALGELIRALGLEGAVLEANPLAKRRYVVRKGKTLALPGSPLDFLRTPLFSAMDKLRLLKEPFVGRSEEDETLAAFVRRRLGPGFLDWAIDPFVSGVYAGDPARLSVRAAVPKVWQLEQAHGSLIRGALVRLRARRQEGLQTGPVGRMLSFVQGMEMLPAAMGRALGDAVETGVSVERMEPIPSGWRVLAGARSWEASQVILAVPAYAAARLLAGLDASLAGELAGIHYPPVASVALGFPRVAVEHPLDGFGCLIPSREGRRTLGALFSTTLFPERAPDGHVLLTAFIGGRRHAVALDQDDAGLVEEVVSDLTPILGLQGRPDHVRVRRWPQAIPQYEMGHLERIARIDERLAHWPGLHTRANWRDGISVSDCVRNAHALAERLAEEQSAG